MLGQGLSARPRPTPKRQIFFSSFTLPYLIHPSVQDRVSHANAVNMTAYMTSAENTWLRQKTTVGQGLAIVWARSLPGTGECD